MSLALKGLRFAWPQSTKLTLDISNFSVSQGESVFLQGPSGSGKTTLLNLIAGTLLPTSGTIEVCGEDLAKLSETRRDTFRGDHVGFIFQQFNLIPYLSPVENVTLPCEFSDLRRRRVLKNSASLAEEARRLMLAMNLSAEDIGRFKVADLSVGQQQRVACARALMGGPSLLIADEPTSALDQDNRQDFISLLLQEASENKITVLFVSHDSELSKNFCRSVKLSDLQGSAI